MDALERAPCALKRHISAPLLDVVEKNDGPAVGVEERRLRIAEVDVEPKGPALGHVGALLLQQHQVVILRPQMTARIVWATRPTRVT